jgi:hypothetical protein
VPLDRDTQRRIDRANRGKGIFSISAPEYYVPVSLLDRVVVRLGAAAFWGTVGCVGVGLGLLAYVYLLHPLVGVAVEWHQAKTGLAWAVALLLAVPLCGLCWLVVVTVLFALENLFRNGIRGRTRECVWFCGGSSRPQPRSLSCSTGGAR